MFLIITGFFLAQVSSKTLPKLSWVEGRTRQVQESMIWNSREEGKLKMMVMFFWLEVGSDLICFWIWGQYRVFWPARVRVQFDGMDLMRSLVPLWAAKEPI